MRNAFIACLLFALGCGSSEMPSPEIQSRAAELSAVLSSQKAVETKQDVILDAVNTNTIAITEVRDKVESLEASLAKSEPQNGKDGDPASAPNPPAKANTARTPVKVATPGDFSEPETLVELATRLYAQGVHVNNKTREELEAIDAQMKAGQPVTGAMFQNYGTSAITSKRSAVRFVPRGSSVVQWQNYSAQSTCGPNGCPPRRSR